MKIIGASAIGHPCERYVWLSCRNVDTLKSDDLEAIFAEGRRLESVVLAQLRARGEVIDDRDQNGNQFWVHHPSILLAGGFVDAIGHSNGEDYVVEVKSANARNFAIFQKSTIAKANPRYASQLNCYIRWCGFERGRWVVINKETEELYEEWFAFDADLYAKDEERIRRMRLPAMPEPKHEFTCKWCEVRHICQGALPEPDCRVCINNMMSHDKWLCGKSTSVCSEFVYSDAVLTNAGFFFTPDHRLYDEYGQTFEVVDLKSSVALKHKIDSGYRPRAGQMPITE